jgi:hypothetical protein
VRLYLSMMALQFRLDTNPSKGRFQRRQDLLASHMVCLPAIAGGIARLGAE